MLQVLGHRIRLSLSLVAAQRLQDTRGLLEAMGQATGAEGEAGARGGAMECFPCVQVAMECFPWVQVAMDCCVHNPFLYFPAFLLLKASHTILMLHAPMAS